ncbi:MAG: DUF1080 domain-containing protein [Verrucomicrobiota bacterium]
MRSLLVLVCFFLSLLSADEEGFVNIFDGQSLQGWSCVQKGVFSVGDRSIKAENKKSSPIPDNRFLVWDRGAPGDFELKLEYKISGDAKANAGIQIRSSADVSGHLIGYQADIDMKGQWVGCLYDEHTGRKLLAKRGQRVSINKAGERIDADLDDKDTLLDNIEADDWNEYHIIAKGSQITLKINGVLMCEVIDEQIGEADKAGLLALQIHKGPPMVVEYRNIRLKNL